jgi:signal transduction histidine kinase
MDMRGDEDKRDGAPVVALRGGQESSQALPLQAISESNNTLKAMLEAMPVSAVLLDYDRRIVATNTRIDREFGGGLLRALTGKRLGDAVGCVRADESSSGCGSSSACAWCGALRALTDSMRLNRPVTSECRLLVDPDRGGSLDVEVRATPVQLTDRRLTVVTLRDISAEKRRRVLERIFFHDVLNTAGGICGIANVLAETTDPVAEEEFKGMLLSLSEQLIEEINSQRQLMAAETGELKVAPAEIAVPDLLRNLRASWSGALIAANRTVAIGNMPQIHLTTDVILLRRIVGNMIKNALEATEEGGVVTILAEDAGDWVAFSVHNAGGISQEVRHQIFLRSFSTKGEGRGIGTYSIKLLGEKYLGGTVGFSSSEATGTTFTIRLPRQWRDCTRPDSD